MEIKLEHDKKDSSSEWISSFLKYGPWKAQARPTFKVEGLEFLGFGPLVTYHRVFIGVLKR
jgi:hypothetical protein